MYNIPENLKYTKEHEWVRSEEEKYVVTFGITDFAQNKLGDIVYIELPEVDTTTQQSSELCVVESVKAASDIYMPISGTIAEINTDLMDTPDMLNKSPYEDAWIAKIIGYNKEELDELMTAEEYEIFLKESAA